MSPLRAICIVACLLAVVPIANAADWPQYRGPNQDGISLEKFDVWPSTGPKLVWKVKDFSGFGSFAVSGDKVFTLVSRDINGVSSEICLALDATTGNELWSADVTKGVKFPTVSDLAGANPHNGEWNFNTTRIIGRDATKLRDMTEGTIEARRQVEEVAAFVRKYIPGFQNAVVSETALLGIRESRRISADYTVTAEDILQVPKMEDCIARGDWYIDIHSPTGEGTQRRHPPEGKWYEIPYRSIRARGIDNLLIASRCIDSTHEAHAAIRVTPQVMAIGQGAGTAAALCVKKGLCSTRQLDATLLRETLRAQGALV